MGYLCFWITNSTNVQIGAELSEACGVKWQKKILSYSKSNLLKLTPFFGKHSLRLVSISSSDLPGLCLVTSGWSYYCLLEGSPLCTSLKYTCSPCLSQALCSSVCTLARTTSSTLLAPATYPLYNHIPTAPRNTLDIQVFISL